MTGSTVPDLLDDDTVGRYLLDRGVIETPPRAVRRLGGGVSNVVLLVEAGPRRVVLKQSLPQLKVAADWPAKRERTLTEAAALELIAGLTPDAAPPLLDADGVCCTLTIEAAPAGWDAWKSDLLAGNVEAEIASRLGQILGVWHRSTATLEVPDDPEAFEQLRLGPYYRTIAARHPALAPRILAGVEELAHRPLCLVHGDCSPKNVLTSGRADDLWIIDFETAHRGNPVFDVAFLVSHLVLKAFHRPAVAHRLRTAAQRFLHHYDGSGATGAADHTVLARHLGCLLLARVDGKSPVEYLDGKAAGQVRALAIRLLHDPAGNDAGLDDIFDDILAAAGDTGEASP